MSHNCFPFPDVFHFRFCFYFKPKLTRFWGYRRRILMSDWSPADAFSKNRLYPRGDCDLKVSAKRLSRNEWNCGCLKSYSLRVYGAWHRNYSECFGHHRLRTFCDTLLFQSNRASGKCRFFVEQERAVRFRCCGLEFAPASQNYVYNVILSKFWYCHPIIFDSPSLYLFSERTQPLEHYAFIVICYIFQPFRQSSGRFYNIH